MLNEEFLGAGAFPDLLPRPRGELSGRLLAALRGPAESLAWPDSDAVAAATSEDFDLALYCCYELHYGGLDGVDEEWEWEPGLLGFRALLERRLEAELRALVGPVEVGPDEVVTELHRLAGSGGGRSLSGWLSEQGTFDQLREVLPCWLSAVPTRRLPLGLLSESGRSRAMFRASSASSAWPPAPRRWPRPSPATSYQQGAMVDLSGGPDLPDLA